MKEKPIESGADLLSTIEEEDARNPDFVEDNTFYPHPTIEGHWVSLGHLRKLIADPADRLAYLKENPWVIL